ncbi:TPA: hypothetical protein MJA58_12775 [Klebsiella pneumoniae]|nr:hypothetical protein [Klebsiella pneumoniae]HBX6131382.1 hypothetical protein [Klebsiella pneumoniae]HBY0026807.1 hypothetical protein [Klebsiella pneumoniae]HBY4495248.1 hypothetical protein [Klebsiella pneumoniae]HBY9628178.1 hypothetical protein [Klebsiella pneumoniae]
MPLAVAVSVVARYIQHDFCLGGVFESPKTWQYSVFKSVSNLQAAFECLLGNLKNVVPLVKLA